VVELGASGFAAFVNATVVGTGVGATVVVVAAGAVVLAGPACGLELLDEHAVSMQTPPTMRNPMRARTVRILASVVVAVPFAVFGVPLLVAGLDLFLPVLRGRARRVRPEPA
jgi:hypothetical protein